MINQKFVIQDLNRRGRVSFASDDMEARRNFRRLSDSFENISRTKNSFKRTLRDASEMVFSDFAPNKNRDQAANAIQKMKQMCDYLEKNCSRISDYFDM